MSQIGQDRWVESILDSKRNGFFVELGAADGVNLSNSFYFERHLEWKGVCIEPNDVLYQKLKVNRTCILSNELVSSHAGQIVDFSMLGEVSGIIDSTTGPFTTRQDVSKKHTTTLSNILDSAGAPSCIDYLSLDVEGHEYAILSTFPFDKYSFRCITVEHNEPHVGPTQQMKIRRILEENGYQFVKGNDDIHHWNHGPIDDFYIHPAHVKVG